MRRLVSPYILMAALIAGLVVLAAAPAQAGPRPMVLAGGPSFGVVIGGPVYPAPPPPPPPPPPGYYQAPMHRYYYYPNRRVYYDLDRSLWFWLGGAGWSFGAALPPAYYGDLGTHVFFSLDTDRPYRYYDRHYRSYPPVRPKRWAPPPRYNPPRYDRRYDRRDRRWDRRDRRW